MESLNINIDKSSNWKIHTPSAQSMRLPFYLLEYGHFIAFDGYYTQRENSPQFLLFCTLNGEGTLNYNGIEYKLVKDSVAIINCNPLHAYSTTPGKTWDFLWFHFNGCTANEFYNMYNDEGSLYIGQIASNEINTIFSIVAMEPDTNLFNDLEQNDLITQLMSSLIKNKLLKERASTSPNVTKKITSSILYMRENLSKKITLEDIASHVFTSKYYFIRSFKRQIGLSPYNYLLYLRINKAKELLASTDLPLDEIAQQSGFCDSKNLIYNFKKAVQLTPMQYRNANPLKKGIDDL